MKTEERPLERRLISAFVVPFVLLIAAGTVLAFQLAQVSSDEEWLDQTNAVTSKSYESLKRIVDQETGLRGYLLTGDRRFLEPYETAAPVEAISELRRLVADNPQQVARVDVVRERYDAWLAESADLSRGGSPDELRTPAALSTRRYLMDRVRSAMAAIIDAEGELRHVRAERARVSNERAKVAFVGLLGAVALAIAVFSRQQLTATSKTYQAVLEREKDARSRLEKEEWIRIGQMKVAEAVQGEHSLAELGRRVLEPLALYTGAEVGAFFAAEPTGHRLQAAIGVDPAKVAQNFGEGEGLVGRAAAGDGPMFVRDVPADFLRVRSGTGEREPVEVALVPARADKRTDAVLELAFLRGADDGVRELLGRIGQAIAIAVRSANYRSRLEELLEESQRQAEELQSQQEELRVANEGLQERTTLLVSAQAELEERQGELEATNASLEEQREELEKARRGITEKAVELERVSTYKSQFLANMSHELRTPLNSALILAKLLADNREGNLTKEQVQFAETIHAAGYDLLTIIDDVLDVSKIEAGKMEVRPGVIEVRALLGSLVRLFEPMAKDKGIELGCTVNDSVPGSMVTDSKRLQQILKNLLSNAIKFTEKGAVAVEVAKRDGWIDFSVRDTGIGIAPSQLSPIFEAFRQADGTAVRKYGGTGLGLSIARDLARLLGGDIQADSQEGVGSKFTVSLPIEIGASASTARDGIANGPSNVASPTRSTNGRSSYRPVPIVLDDRDEITATGRMLLIVEDDPAFAKILVDLAHELRFQAVVTASADEAVALAKKLVPSGIILDVKLPDHSGLSVLDRVKRDASLRHVPVHVVSVEDHATQARAMGAASYLVKPVTREKLVDSLKNLEDRLTTPMRRLLLVDGNDTERASLSDLLGWDGIEIVGVGSAADALEKLRAASFDCVVMDLELPDGTGTDVLGRMSHDDTYAFPPVIVHTARTLTSDEEHRLRNHASSIIIKGARSRERLLDEVTLFLHRVEAELPPDRRRMVETARDREAAFEGRRILVVDDDVRTVFALMNVLEARGAKVVVARNGREALSILDSQRDISVVLMDIMMPEMDGLEAMRRIREDGRWSKLPIISLTAKTRREDQERCIAAGANDYISKPLDVDLLMSLLRVWMPR